MKKLCYVLLIFSCLGVKAQRLPFKGTVIDSMNDKINLYGLKTQSPLLFVHFDKNVYTNNENVWFTAYLFNADYSKYKTLSLALVKDDDRSILMEDRFIIKNGLAFGNTFVPDSVGPGNYTFIATTNRLRDGHPEVVFTQPVTIKTESPQGYTASLNPIDTSLNAQQQKVMLLVNFSNIKDIPASIPVSYYIGNAAHPLQSATVKTKAGQYIFEIPSNQLTQGNNILHVRVNYNKEAKDISMVLPVRSKPAAVNFYPEGGNMVVNMQSTVGWEAKSGAGIPMGVSAMLYEDNKLIDTIQTNSYGLGSFKITPKANSKYDVKLYGLNKKDTAYQLPNPIARGPALTLPNAVVNDTLTVIIKDDQKEKLYLIGHNYKQLFFATPISMTLSDKRIKVVIKDIPKGLTQLTLTDSVGRPFAERTFFAHYDQRTSSSMITDKSEYAARQKVNVKIRLSNTNKADSGFVSVACVQENRIQINKKNDIESYFYLEHDINDLPVRETYLTNTEADKQFLEGILLVKGWSRYKWTDMLRSGPTDTIFEYQDLLFKGVLTKYLHPLTGPTSIINMNAPIDPVVTDKTGNFTLNNESLITNPDKKVTLFIKNEFPQNNAGSYRKYHIQMSDAYHTVNKELAVQLKPKDYNVFGQESTQQMNLSDNEHAIHLKQVTINDEKDDSFFGSAHGPNDCGDYVCRFNILNCPNHRHESDNRPPVVGEMYLIDGRHDFYVGCTSRNSIGILSLKGIYTAQEFYPADYSQVNPSQPEYVSTLYWKHLVKVSSVKDAEFSFYTSDITGRFKIVVQGVTSTDVTYGEATFNVVKAK